MKYIKIRFLIKLLNLMCASLAALILASMVFTNITYTANNAMQMIAVLFIVSATNANGKEA